VSRQKGVLDGLLAHKQLLGGCDAWLCVLDAFGSEECLFIHGAQQSSSFYFVTV
jgi:hypothetical protein